MTYFFRIISFIKHWFISGNEHRLHSPFLFSLYINVIKKPSIKENNQAELFRKQLIKDETIIKELDFGTGNKKNQKVSAIANKSLKSKKEYLFLANIAKYINPSHIIELGTCFGLSTSYLNLGVPNTEITTIEGNPERLKIARKLIGDKTKIVAIEGNIDDLLIKVVTSETELIYIDANHTKEATLHYFNIIKNRCKGNFYVILDDIYYNQDMNSAWKEIKKAQRNFVTLDFFYFGVVISRKEMLEQHFNLKM